MPKRTVPGAGQSVTINMRCVPSLRNKVERACGESGRSIAAEISHRVEQTFMEEEFRRCLIMINDLVLMYKGKDVVLLTEAEIVNNTYDGLVNTGYLIERAVEAMRDTGVFDDLYHPERGKSLSDA